MHSWTKSQLEKLKQIEEGAPLAMNPEQRSVKHHGQEPYIKWRSRLREIKVTEWLGQLKTQKSRKNGNDVERS